MQYLLDSDVLIDFCKKKAEIVDLIDRLLNTGELTTSILSITELRAGWSKQQADFFLPRLYKLLRIKNLQIDTAELAGRLRYEFKTKGVSLSTVDCLIAATAILEKCLLVTRNKKDYPMPKINFLDF